MTSPVIETPRGKIVVNKVGKAELTWKTGFKDKWQGQYTAAQKFVDHAVLDKSEMFTPKLTGMLSLSGILGTFPGSGLVQWIAPYARRQYFSKRKPGSQTGPLRGPAWFERMRAVHGDEIISGAKKLAGGGR